MMITPAESDSRKGGADFRQIMNVMYLSSCDLRSMCQTCPSVYESVGTGEAFPAVRTALRACSILKVKPWPFDYCMLRFGM